MPRAPLISTHVLDAITDMEGLPDGLTIRTKMTSFLDHYGIDGFTAALIRSVETEAPVVEWVHQLDQDWLDHYFGAGLEAHDYALRRHGTWKATEPFLKGRPFMDRLPDLRPGEADMYRAMEPYGLRSGLVVPMWAKTPDGPMPTGYSMWSPMEGDAFEGMLGEHGAEIFLYLYAAKDRIIPRLVAESMGIEELSPREKDCLLLAAKGLRAEDIADRLCVAAVTANVHLKKARKKLRVKTTTEAVARALIIGLISP